MLPVYKFWVDGISACRSASTSYLSRVLLTWLSTTFKTEDHLINLVVDLTGHLQRSGCKSISRNVPATSKSDWFFYSARHDWSIFICGDFFWFIQSVEMCYVVINKLEVITWSKFIDLLISCSSKERSNCRITVMFD